MPDRDAARRAIVRIISRNEDENTEWGYLGILNAAGDEYLFDIAEKPGFVHCRIENGLGMEYAECIPRVALDPYVRCKFRKHNGVLVAVEFDPIRAVDQYRENAPALGVPSLPMPGRGAIFPPPAFGDPATKLLDAGVASAGNDRFIILAAEAGTDDDCIELSGLSVGDEAWLFADAGDTITLKHNAGGATDKFLFYGEADIELSGSKGLRVVKKAAGVVVNSVDAAGTGGAAAFTDLSDVPASYSGQANKFVAVRGDEGGLEFVTTAASEVGAKLRRVGTVLHDETKGSAGTFDVTSISQNYDDLEIILEGRGAANSSGGVLNVNVSLNNDTTDANYRLNGSSAGASPSSQRLAMTVVGNDATSGRTGSNSVMIRDYTSALYKKMLLRHDSLNSTAYTFMRGVEWVNTSAVNRVTIAVANANTNFAAGARLRIIGWKTEAIGGLDNSDVNVSNPPTDAELDSAFGTPAAVGDGFAAIVDNNGANSAVWLVASNGASWWYVGMTKAT